MNGFKGDTIATHMRRIDEIEGRVQGWQTEYGEYKKCRRNNSYYVAEDLKFHWDCIFRIIGNDLPDGPAVAD